MDVVEKPAEVKGLPTIEEEDSKMEDLEEPEQEQRIENFDYLTSLNNLYGKRAKNLINIDSYLKGLPPKEGQSPTLSKDLDEYMTYQN
jgi:hypothetical protein